MYLWGLCLMIVTCMWVCVWVNSCWGSLMSGFTSLFSLTAYNNKWFHLVQGQKTNIQKYMFIFKRSFALPLFSLFFFRLVLRLILLLSHACFIKFLEEGFFITFYILLRWGKRTFCVSLSCDCVSVRGCERCCVCMSVLY